MAGKRRIVTSVGEAAGTSELSHTAVGVGNGAAALEDSLAVPPKVKHGLIV